MTTFLTCPATKTTPDTWSLAAGSSERLVATPSLSQLSSASHPARPPSSAVLPMAVHAPLPSQIASSRPTALVSWQVDPGHQCVSLLARPGRVINKPGRNRRRRRQAARAAHTAHNENAGSDSTGLLSGSALSATSSAASKAGQSSNAAQLEFCGAHATASVSNVTSSPASPQSSLLMSSPSNLRPGTPLPTPSQTTPRPLTVPSPTWPTLPIP